MSLTDNIKEFLSPIADACEIELVQVKYEYKDNGMNLTLFIDKPSGITFDDCERFHYAVDKPLDDLDFTNGQQYTLNVSSLGLDHKLKTQDDFRRNLNRVLVAKFYAKINGQKEFIGQLASYTNDTITLVSQDNNTQTINLKDISSLTQHINFK